MLKISSVALLCLLTVSLVGCNPGGDRLLIFAGSASKPPLDEAAKAFAARRNVAVEVTYGGSGTVLSQMMLGRIGDLYIPGSQDFMDLAEEQGAVDPKTRRIIAYLLPVIAVQKGNPKGIRSLDDLTRPGLRVGIGNPETVCLGAFAVEIFRHARLWEQVQPNIVVYAKSCEDLASLLVLGHVDAVIGWDVFDDWHKERIDVVPLSKEEMVKVGNIPVAISVFSKNRHLAQEFIDFVTSPEGRAFFARYGYQVEPP